MKERWTTRWFRKRALLYHLLVMILVPGCLLAGWWQINRAESGNTLSYLYSVEWPIFAILSIVGWWQLIHEDPADVDARKIERARRAANRGPFVPPPPEAESGFYHPLGTGSYGALDRGTGRGGELILTPDGYPDGDATQDGMAIDDDVTVHALSSYNAYLARLSAGGGRKSWRNPHGLARGARRIEPPPPTVDAGPGAAGAVPPGPPPPASVGPRPAPPLDRPLSDRPRSDRPRGDRPLSDQALGDRPLSDRG